MTGWLRGDQLEMRAPGLQERLDRLGVTQVDGVQVYRCNTELVPSDELLAAAGLSDKVVR